MEIKNSAALKKVFNDLPEDVRSFFHHLSDLLDEPSKYDLALAHCFMRIEEAHNRALYAGLVRELYCDSNLAKMFVDKQHLTAKGFNELFKNIFGEPVPNVTSDKLIEAQKIRNALIHGKGSSYKEKREAIAFSLMYSKELSEFLVEKIKVNPFGKLSGIVGKLKPKLLKKNQSKWIIIGVGFTSKNVTQEIEI